MHQQTSQTIGKHLIIDLWQASHLDDLVLIEQTLQECVKAADATLLDIQLHHFGPGHGVTGVALLAESHISIHTWPERAFAAVDIFMCGETKPERCIEPLKRAFATSQIVVTQLDRGRSTIKADMYRTPTG